MKEENWLPIENTDGVFESSSLGRIRHIYANGKVKYLKIHNYSQKVYIINYKKVVIKITTAEILKKHNIAISEDVINDVISEHLKHVHYNKFKLNPKLIGLKPSSNIMTTDYYKRIIGSNNF